MAVAPTERKAFFFSERSASLPSTFIASAARARPGPMAAAMSVPVTAASQRNGKRQDFGCQAATRSADGLSGEPGRRAG